MKTFVIKISLFCLPFLMPVLFYIVTDPFKVIYRYSEQINATNNYIIGSNRDYQSTQLFLWNYEKYKYNSFILGNSRSLFYQVNTWKKYIKGNIFHFDASAESIYGINCKLKLLDELKVDIKNALIIIDEECLKGTKNSKGHLFIKHPKLSKESYLMFQFEMFKGYFPKAMIAFIELYVTGCKKPYMEKYGVKNNVWKHDMRSNQLSYYLYDQQIKKNPILYYYDKTNLFYKRDTIQHFSNPVIHKEQEVLLKNIQLILKSHRTNYKIIINPLYNQNKLSKEDLEYLQKLFGTENVFDFSGINSFTNDYHNYYETSHYRPNVCDSILNIIYQ